jgi:hypothetical protein
LDGHRADRRTIHAHGDVLRDLERLRRKPQGIRPRWQIGGIHNRAR